MINIIKSIWENFWKPKNKKINEINKVKIDTLELFLENIPESFNDEKGQLVFLSPSQEAKDNFTNFFNSLPKQYKNIIDFEDDTSTTSHGTILIEWNHNNKFLSVEVGKTLIGYISDTSNVSSEPNSNGIPCKDAIEPIVKILNDIYQ